MRAKSNLIIVLLVSVILTVIILTSTASAQAGTTANITGRVTYQGNYQDGATVELVGGSSTTTANGGYYTLSAIPNIAVSVKASFSGHSETKTVMVGESGSTMTQNFDIAPLPTATPESTNLGPIVATIVGLVKYDGTPLSGITVNVSPVTTTVTDNTGHYQAGVPGGINVTVSVVTAVGSDSKTIMTPSSGNVVVNLNVSTTPAATPTPAATATPEATATATITATPVITPATTPTATAVPATPTAAPAGTESGIALAAIGLLAAVGMTMLRRE
jgi:hypothetical protein